MIIPFVFLLLSIAVIPLVNRKWWDRNYPYVAFGLSAITIAYYVLVLQSPARMLHLGFEYLSFIVLLGSLFIVAGGIHIRIKGKSTPVSNLFLLAVGAIASNVVGGTCVSMVMIRPYLRFNRQRLRGFHIVFFIFIVSNIGGALTPIAGLPLFLGYLKGIPFFWVFENVWRVWTFAVGIILLVFFAIDFLSFRKFGAGKNTTSVEELHEQSEVSGMQNILFLILILAAVFIQQPHFVRELMMVAAAAGSYFTTKKEIHEKNGFDFLPLKELAILFFGIFATMVPALDWLELNAAKIGLTSAGQFYWGTGILSSLLDNAPTYLNSLSASIGLFIGQDIVLQVQQIVSAHGVGLANIAGAHAGEVRATVAALMKYHADLVTNGSVPVDYIHTAYLIANRSLYLKAISIAAVFFGATTYIGNGPNFMVKSIAEQAGVKCPSFGGYVLKYSLPVLLPVFALVWWLMKG